MFPKIIGFTGRAYSGKTEAAKTLIPFGFTKFSFGDPVKNCCSYVFDIPTNYFYDEKLKEEIIPRYGKSPRQIMQLFATDCMRFHFGMKFWVHKIGITVDKLIETDFATCDDIRFDEEAEYVKSSGGIIVEVIRKHYDKRIDQLHKSEQGISRHFIDHTITNNGKDLETYQLLIKSLLKTINDRG